MFRKIKEFIDLILFDIRFARAMDSAEKYEKESMEEWLGLGRFYAESMKYAGKDPLKECWIPQFDAQERTH